jgi:hypothetical protein
VGSIPASRTKIRKWKGLMRNRQALFLFCFALAQQVPSCRTTDCYSLDRQGVMANDKHIALRASLLEYQMETLTELVSRRAPVPLRHQGDLERVNQNMRNWVITVGISTTALQFALQYALFQFYLHAG